MTSLSETSDEKVGEPVKEVTIEGKTYPCLIEGDPSFDIVVLGTGLKEMIITACLTGMGKKVLVLDRNSYYGGETATLNLDTLFKKFKGVPYDREAYKKNNGGIDLGRSNDYCVDLIPKYIMGAGQLTKLLVATGAEQYMDFSPIEASYVCRKGKSPAQVPCTPMEAISTSLVGMMQKYYLRQYLLLVGGFDENDESTWKGHKLRSMTAAQLYKAIGLDRDTQDFVGHAAALFQDESYQNRPAIELVKANSLYVRSWQRYDVNSPFLYVQYGLSMMPEAYSRLAAVSGSLFMLDKAPLRIVQDSSGKVKGVIAEEYNPEKEYQRRMAKKEGKEVDEAPIVEAGVQCEAIIGDPTYFLTDHSSKVKKTVQVARSICILAEKPPGVTAETCQIIVPQRQCNTPRKSDIFISVLSSRMRSCPKGLYVAIVSTTVETDDYKKELVEGISRLGRVLERFDYVTQCYAPTDDGSNDKIYVSSSYDASTHFQTTTAEAFKMYETVSGEKLDLKAMEEKTKKA